MFMGEFRHQVDVKGRVAVPAQFRRSLPEGSVLAFGPDRRLVIRPPDAWAELERQHQQHAATLADARMYMRVFYSSALPVDLDGQGRLLIPEKHRTHAAIGERAVFIGVRAHVEVVGEEIWDREQAQLGADGFTALNDSVMAGSAPPAPHPSPA